MRNSEFGRGWKVLVACLLGVACRDIPADPGRADAGCGERARPGALGRMLGHSPAMESVRERVRLYAPSDQPVLIHGESGTGKELVARALHDESPRRAGPFVVVNCPALVATLLEAELFGIEDGTATGVRGRKGKFEQASGGTLFLDEVADLSPQGQASVLRVLQERAVERVGGQRTTPVDVRIVSATNREIAPRVATQTFRPDLYSRLRVLPVRVPPLRDRGDDTLDLVQAFLAGDPRGWRWELRREAADALLACTWPANVRDVQAVAHLIRTFARSPAVDRALVQEVLSELGLVPCLSLADRPLTVKEVAAHHARSVLMSCGGNKTRACQQLGISVKTLRAYLRLLNDPRVAESRRKAA